MRENCVTKQESRDIARCVAWVIVFHIGKREDPGDEVAVNASAFSATVIDLTVEGTVEIF